MGERRWQSKKKKSLKEDHTKQYREGTFFPFIYFCCGPCLHLSHLAGVCFGTAKCVCKLFSFPTVSRDRSTSLDLGKSNPQTNWVCWPMGWPDLETSPPKASQVFQCIIWWLTQNSTSALCQRLSYCCGFTPRATITKREQRMTRKSQAVSSHSISNVEIPKDKDILCLNKEWEQLCAFNSKCFSFLQCLSAATST